MLGDTIVGWLRNSAFSVQEVLPNDTLAPLDLTPAKLALQAYDADMEASKAGIVGVNSVIAGVAFRNKLLETFLRSYAKLHSNALRYRYWTKFRVIPLSACVCTIAET